MLSWDPVSEAWSPAGRLGEGRSAMAVLEVPEEVLGEHCTML